MLDFDAVLELMKKYGYSSTSIHPYIYQNGDSIGICYTYIDEEYGLLERIKIFDDIKAFEEFLKEQSWLKSNAKNYNVRMILDNYESSMPKILYLRNEKVMVEGEMADIDNFDLRESQRKQMDEVSQILYEAGDLLLVYDEIKERQLQYLQKIIELKNTLRGKYFDLQKEVDAYNNYKVERNLTLIPDVLDKGSINEVLEVAIKDQYNMYIANRPSLAEIKDFIKQVWDLNLNLELNTKYYEAQKEENDIRNEIKLVDKKLELMNSLKEELKPLFGIDLVSRFKKINDKCRKESKYMSKNYVEEHLALVNKKYSVYDKLNLLYASDYLREAIQNTNYDGLANKYSSVTKEEEINRAKLPLNEVVSDLAIQYRDKLSVDEQSILVLYNNSKYAKLFNKILEIDNYETLPIKNVIRGLNSIKGLSKLKTECYENVKKRIDDPVNEKIKNSLFSNVDFATFETFISSMIKKLVTLKSVNSKMKIKSDFNMYTLVSKGENIPGRKYISVTNDLNTLLNEAKENKCMIGICLLKEGLPVLYSPYYFDLGDMYSKGASPLMEIKEMVNFDLLIEVADTTIYVDENKVVVSRYYTEPKMNENISYVDDIKLSYSTTFCKYAIASNLQVSSEVPVSNSDAAVALAPVINNTVEEVAKSESSVDSVVKQEETSVVNEVQESPKVEQSVVESQVDTSENVAKAQTEKTPVIEEKTTEENKESAIETKQDEVKPDIEEKEEETTIQSVEKPKDVTEIIGNEEKEQPVDKQEETSLEVKEEVKVGEQPVIETKEEPIITENQNEVVANNEVSPKEEGKENSVVIEQKEQNVTPIIEEKKDEVEVDSVETKSSEKSVEEPKEVENNETIVKQEEVQPVIETKENSGQKEETVVPVIEENKEEIKAPDVTATNEASNFPKVETPLVETPVEVQPVIEEKKTEIQNPVEVEQQKVEKIENDESKLVNENNGLATFDSNQKTNNEVNGVEKQDVITEDFKTVTTNNEVQKDSLLQNQNNAKIVKKVSSVGTSTTNNTEAFSNETNASNTIPPKKNVVVKSVGSIGKPLNK